MLGYTAIAIGAPIAVIFLALMAGGQNRPKASSPVPAAIANVNATSGSELPSMVRLSPNPPMTVALSPTDHPIDERDAMLRATVRRTAVSAPPSGNGPGTVLVHGSLAGSVNPKPDAPWQRWLQ